MLYKQVHSEVVKVYKHRLQLYNGHPSNVYRSTTQYLLTVYKVLSTSVVTLQYISAQYMVYKAFHC